MTFRSTAVRIRSSARAATRVMSPPTSRIGAGDDSGGVSGKADGHAAVSWPGQQTSMYQTGSQEEMRLVLLSDGMVETTILFLFSR